MGAGRPGIFRTSGARTRESCGTLAHCSERFEAHDVPSDVLMFASKGHISKANKLIEAAAEVHSGFAQS